MGLVRRAFLTLVVSGTGLLVPGVPALADAGPALAVDVTAERHAISPDIYGMNFADPTLAAELGLTSDRWGGNATSRYNYLNDFTNTGSDWFFENVKDSQSLDSFVSTDLQHGVQPVVTVPMLGWVAKDSPTSHPYACGFKVSKYGAQPSTDTQWDPDCGNGVGVGGAELTGNDPTDTSVTAGPAFVQSMVRHLVSTHGDAAHGGLQTYELDNEPTLWNSTHRDVHPQPLTYDELWQTSQPTALAVKTADPGAKVAGPGDWGWCAYFFSAADNCSDGNDSASHGHTPLAAWYLQQFAAYDAAHHQRLLDYFDEHFYPQETGVALSSAGSASTQALRLMSTRALWDPSYRDESWISDMGMGAVQLITRMRQWVADSYPGTKTSLSEYNWGGLESMNGALAQADVLGIFGREGLDRAMLWAPPKTDQPGAFAFRIYRDYDGHGGRFGDVSVKARSADQAKLAVYAAQRSADGATTIVVVNKTATDLTAPLTLSGSTATTAQVFAYAPGDLAHIAAEPDLAISGGSASHTYPGNSITMFVVPAGTAAPAATTAAITVSPASVRYGAQLAISGSLTAGSTGVAGVPVDLQAQRPGTSTWVTVTSVRSAGDGSLWATVKPRWTVSWRWRFPGSSTASEATSPARSATLHAAVTDSASATHATRGRPVVVRASVRPARPGATVVVQLLSGSAWKTVRTLTLGSSSSMATTFRWTGAGTRELRVRWTGKPELAAANGPTLKIVIR